MLYSNGHIRRLTEKVSSRGQQPNPEERSEVKSPGGGGLHKLDSVSLSILDETSREYSSSLHSTRYIVLGRYLRDPHQRES